MWQMICLKETGYIFKHLKQRVMNNSTNNFRSILSLLIAVLFSINTFATVYTTTSNGNWTSNSIWSPSKPNYTWGFNDTVVVNHNINLNTNLYVYGKLVISQGAELTSNTKSMTVKEYATLVNNGVLTVKSFAADWGQTEVQNNGTFTVKNNFNNYEGNFTNSSVLAIGGYLNNQWDGVFVNDVNGSVTVGNYFKNNHVFTNNGTLTVSKDITNTWSNTMINSGTLIGNKKFKNQGSFTNNGTTTIAGDITNDWSSTITNSGNMVGNSKMTNRGTLTNSGAITISGFFKNQSTINNYNTINVLNDMNNYWSNIDNAGTINVLNNLSNTGTIHNNGAMFVDGTATSNTGTIDGSGNLCNSNGVTDPTGGSKAGVTCEICSGEGSTLPVALVDFSAKYNTNAVTLSWTTVSEINNAYFEVLRSVDGVNYELVANVKGAGNSNITNNYSAIDDAAVAGVNYYILKQVDFDGTTTLSSPIQIVVESEIQVSLYPNPVKSGSNLFIETGSEEIKTVEVYSVAGQLVRSFTTTDATAEVNTYELVKGMYIVRIIQNTNIISKKVQVN